MRTFGASIAVEELQPYADWCKKHDIICDESDPAAYENAEFVAKYFIETWQQDITDANLEAAFSVLQPHLKFIILSPAQLVAKQAGIDQHQADVVVSVLRRRQLDQRYAVEDAVTVAKYILAQGWPFGPYSIDLCLSNLVNTPGGAKVHWVRKLQDNEVREMERREAQRKDLEEIRKTRQEQASVEVHPELRLSEKAKFHRDTMRRLTETTTIGSADNSAYWQSQAESVHLDVRSNLKQQELQHMFVMDSAKPTEIDWQATFKARRWECDQYRNRGGK